MPSWEIDRFGVRPTGFLASWRYVKVMTDELGNITIEAIPGKEFPNLECIANYKKTDRRFRTGDLITEYCNRTLFTKFRIYAQDCKPYAYAQTDLNVALCGYVAPGPPPPVPPPDPFGTPAINPLAPYVPANPFGAAPVYGLYAYIAICDVKNEPVTINIYKRNFVGVATKINNTGSSPAILSYKNTDENKLSPLRTCELILTLVSDATFNLETLYTQDRREFKVEALKYGVVKFSGFGTAQEASEEFKATPYDVTWRANDGLGELKNIPYPMPVGSKTDIQQKFISILAYCLSRTNLNLDIATICNLYEVKMKTGIDDDPLAQSSVNPLRATEKGIVMNCYKVLEQVCLTFGAFLVQDNGKWVFVRQGELGNSILRRRTYNHTGLFLNSQQFYNTRVATCKGTDISILDDNPGIRLANAIKRAEVIVDYSDLPFLIFNGDFELWDGFNFPCFTKYGGIQISRVENKIKTTTGEIPSGNFALQFDALADNAKYVELAPVIVNAGDVITFAYNVGSTAPDLSRPYKGVTAFKFRIKLNDYYLTNPDNDNNYKWVKQLAICTNNVYNPKGTIDAYQATLEIPEVPESGNMIIELFGFVKELQTGPYYPVAIDNLTLNKTSRAKVRGRTLYVTEQNGFYTETLEETVLMFGDYNGTETVVRPARVNANTSIKNDYYAIRTSDGSYSTEWYEYGSNASPVPIGIALSRNILKAYQKPYHFLASSFLGNNISYLDIFNVNLPNDTTGFNDRIFALLSGDFNLISGELNNANYVEIFSKHPKSFDIIVPGKMFDGKPPVLQSTNPLPPVTGGGIFTQQFTNEFM